MPVGETSLPGNSFLQRFLLEILEKNHVPLAALKFVPGFGEQVHQLLYGDPYQAHTFFADMHYQVARLLDQDAEHDPVVLARKQAYAEAEERAEYRGTRYNFASGSTEPSNGGAVHDFGQDWKRKIDPIGPPTQEIPDSVSNGQSFNNRLETEIQGPMVNRWYSSESPLSQLE